MAGTLALLILTVGMSLAHFATSGENPVTPPLQLSQSAAADTTFLQIWNKHSTIGRRHWKNLFADLKNLGFSQVILQWTQYDNYQFSSPASPALDNLIAAAAENDISLWIGLSYDSKFWDKIQHQSTKQLQTYFDARTAGNKILLENLEKTIAAAPARIIKGIYISDEIDDLNWVKPENRAAFSAYIKELSDLVSTYTSVRTLAISSFSNGISRPIQYASYISDIIDGTGITTLFFQDGVGVGKLTIPQSGFYAQALNDRLRSDTTVWTVVELFEQTKPDEEFAARPATFDRVLAQIESAKAATPGTIAVFSAPDYLLSNFSGIKTSLGDSWQQWAPKSTDKPANSKNDNE